ncbi:MAG: AMP-binding protein [Rhodobacteraceae bacterium]|nr:AMP-binding protein [Paracoccaceae bacterium]MBL4810900.1 AMP-binding protein [Paracoccaceae bacterium]
MKRLQHRAWPKDLPHDLPKTTTTLYQAFADTAAAHPNKDCLNFYGKTLSYADAHSQICNIAAYLHSECGVKPGDRVSICAQNCPQYMLVFYGILRAGAVVVPINPMNKTKEIKYVVDDAQVEVIFVAQDRSDQIAPLLEDGTLCHANMLIYADFLGDMITLDVPEIIRQTAQPLPEKFTSWAAAAQCKAPAPTYLRLPDDLAVLPYTSGSTGRGKGCMHTNASALHAARAVYDWFGFSGADVFLSVSPMFHVVGLQCGLIVPVVIGATSVILPRWDKVTATKLMRDYKVSVWPTVPTMVMDFITQEDLKRADVASLHTVFGGGIAMPDAVAARLLELTNLTFLEGYGLTETIAPTTANPREKPKRQCGGLPVFNTDVIIVDPDTLAPVPHDEVGEILISGPQVMRGYWNNDAANDEAFVVIDGARFLRTGDLGRVDEDGYVFIVDRLKRMINASGYKVWPTDVEATLYDHPDIVEACVIASPDPYRGETVKALIVLRDGAECTPEDITKWAHKNMAAYKVPRIVSFVNALMKSGSGKVLWRELQAIENAEVNAEKSKS